MNADTAIEALNASVPLGRIAEPRILQMLLSSWPQTGALLCGALIEVNGKGRLMKNLHDKIILVTGASHGIGAAIATEFQNQGAHVITTQEARHQALRHIRLISVI